MMPTFDKGKLPRFLPLAGPILLSSLLFSTILALPVWTQMDEGQEPTLPAQIVPILADPVSSRTIEFHFGTGTEVLRINPDALLQSAEVASQERRIDRLDPDIVTATEGQASPMPEFGEETASPSRVLYEERTVRFISRSTPLDGILTLPRGGQSIPYPAVLMVPGSGRIDRDGRVGPNRPFREIAHGLAVYGIASFRFDKRSLAAPESLDPVKSTVTDDLIDDAIAASDALRSQGGIDGNALAIVGHDLGGSLAATIANSTPSIGAIVILAGSPRPLDEIVRDQIVYLSNQAGKRESVLPDQELSYGTMLARLDSLTAGTLSPQRIVYGISGHYLYDYRNRDLASDLLSFPGPVLILQGGKDYLITKTDFDAWNRIVEEGGKANVTFRYFPQLGHLFIPIEGEVSPGSDARPGNVEPAVIAEIAMFVESLR